MKFLVNLIWLTVWCFFVLAYPGFGVAQTLVNGDAYIDVSTGHRYEKNADNTYTEYTKKGRVFKTQVSPSQPHLCRSPYVLPIQEKTTRVVYEYYRNNRKIKTILPPDAHHPKGYRLADLLTQYWVTPQSDIGLGYTPAGHEKTKKRIFTEAEEPAYYDHITGNRYFKNTDQTYRQYSRKGVLLRSDVPCDQPHLRSSRYITAMGKNSYLLYQKQNGSKRLERILHSSRPSPTGWKCTGILFSVKKHYAGRP